jgi:SAM-dependent methyltransferase
VIVDNSHFAYLALQKGSLDHLKGDRAAWHSAYDRALQDDFESIAPHLPLSCNSVLDIGSGLGGIDVLIDRHYGGVMVRLVDGLADPPVLHFHNRTFNNMAVAEDFQRRNGVVDARGWDAAVCQHKAYAGLPEAFDLIISFGSWCFHYPPEVYLDMVGRLSGPNTVLILDVRADKPLWRSELGQAFREVACAKASRKFNRLVFHAK